MLKANLLQRGQVAMSWLAAGALALSLLLPIALSSSVEAAQITSRKVTIDSSATSGTDTEFAFSYTLPNTTTLEGIIYQFCTTPLGACTLPTGMSVQSATHDSQSFSEATAFTAHAITDENDCDMSTTSSKMCFERVDADAETAAAKTHTISGITPPSSNDTVYVRITFYSDDDFQTADLTGDSGTVAAAFVNQLTLTAAVQENLEFCVGDTFTDAGDSDCTDISGTTVDMGILDTASVNESSVDGAAGDQNGYVMVRTNASGGVVIDYLGGDASGNLVSGTDTLAPQSGAEAALSAGTEAWGMDVDTGAAVTTEGTTANLTMDANFDGDEDVHWGATSTATDTVASSTTVVDDEMLTLDFHGTAAITTATGIYTTTITFIATPTF